MGLNTEDLKKKAEQKEKAGEGIRWEPETGKRNVVRFLPRSLKFFSKEGDNDLAWTYYVHWRLFDVEGWKRIICKQTVGEKCPICDYANSFEDKKKAKQYRCTTQHMYNVLDYEDGRIKMYESGPYIYGEILKFIVDPSWGDSMFDIKNGRDIVILKEAVPASKKGQENPYEVKPLPDRKDITDQLPEKWDEVVDALQTKIPPVKDDATFLTIVEHLRKGTAPAPIIKDQNSQQGQTSAPAAQTAAPAPAAAAPAAAAAAPAPASNIAKPACFGLEFSPRVEKCKNCPVRGECRTIVLSL